MKKKKTSYEIISKPGLFKIKHIISPCEGDVVDQYWLFLIIIRDKKISDLWVFNVPIVSAGYWFITIKYRAKVRRELKNK